MRRLTAAFDSQAISRSVLILAAMLSVTVPARGQSSGSDPVRDVAAISTLQNSVSALGSANGWAGVQDWTITGTIATKGTASANFNWTGSGSEFRFETDTAQKTSVFISGHGKPARMSNGTASPVNYHVARANLLFHLPGLQLSRELNDTSLVLRYVGATTVQGRAAIHVHVSDDSDAVGSAVTPHEWYFDAKTFLPLRVDFRLPTNENANDYSAASYTFSSFQPITGLLVPFQIACSYDYGPSKAATVSSVTFNSGVPSSIFDAPLGGGQ